MQNREKKESRVDVTLQRQLLRAYASKPRTTQQIKNFYRTVRENFSADEKKKRDEEKADEKPDRLTTTIVCRNACSRCFALLHFFSKRASRKEDGRKTKKSRMDNKTRWGSRERSKILV